MLSLREKNKMKYSVIVVWFNPKEEEVKRAEALAEKGVYICVVDNSAEDCSEKVQENEYLHYLHNANKGGIAGGFNLGIEYTRRNRSETQYYFTMDQDSLLSKDYLDNMVDFSIKNNALISCPNFFDRNAKVYGSFVLLTKYGYEITREGKTHFCISSGMCISKRAWDILGQFNELLIIDHVDTDFALRAFKEKIDIYVNYGECLNHAIGERSRHRFCGVVIKPNHHSHVRKYYIVRNGTYLAIKNFGISKGYFLLNIMRVIHEFLSVVLYENNKIEKIHYMIKGGYHGLRGKLGAIKK